MTTAGRRQIAAAFAALFVVALAGCGGSRTTTTTTTTTTTATTATTTTAASGEALAKAAYVHQMSAIGRDLATVGEAVDDAQTPKEAVVVYRKLQTRLRLAERELKAIAPPPAIAKEHAALTKAVGDFADELDPIIREAAAGNLEGISNLRGVRELHDAAAAIQAAGYPIGA